MSSGESASSSDEEEDARDYKKGGYHPVKIGELFKDAAYEVLTKIGWGHFSTVWLAWDRRADRPVALKIQKAAPECTAVHQSNARGPVRGEGTW